MKKTIYYVVSKELENIGGIEEATGNKTITVYNVKDNKIEKWFDVEQTNDENSQEGIIDYLVDNGYSERSESVSYEPYYDEFEFIEL